MSKRRFIAPARAEVDPACFAHPIYADYAQWQAWMRGADWPCIKALNAALSAERHRFALQDRGLMDDGLHYEARIAERGLIATRVDNWHDLFNVMVWCLWPLIKLALNARQCAQIAVTGPSRRNRAQHALTQFDEGGVIVRVRDPELLRLWDRHDWPMLFKANAQAWTRGDIGVVAVIGHALLERALRPGLLLTGKALVILEDADAAGPPDAQACVERVARMTAGAELLHDPLELRPLPLAGIPGWFAGQGAAFYQGAECFRPLRAGRVYPAPITSTG